MTITPKFGLIWFSGFRGEDINVKVYDIRQTLSDNKVHMVIARWAKIKFSRVVNNINTRTDHSSLLLSKFVKKLPQVYMEI